MICRCLHNAETWPQLELCRDIHPHQTVSQCWHGAAYLDQPTLYPRLNEGINGDTAHHYSLCLIDCFLKYFLIITPEWVMHSVRLRRCLFIWTLKPERVVVIIPPLHACCKEIPFLKVVSVWVMGDKIYSPPSVLDKIKWLSSRVTVFLVQNPFFLSPSICCSSPRKWCRWSRKRDCNFGWFDWLS